MHIDIANYTLCCSVYQWDKPPTLPREKLPWIYKGVALFTVWIIDTIGLFLLDKSRNLYPLIAMNLFSKWVETHDRLSL